MKRYVIVRVDNCPSRFEKNFNDYIVCDGRNKDMRLNADKINCNNCRYGDTKEQLIRKIVQVMLRRFKRIYKGKFITVEMAEKQYLEVAKEIVEFLGVEDDKEKRRR